VSTVKHTRRIIFEKLSALLPKDKYVFIPESKTVDAIAKPTLLLTRSRIQPLPEVAISAYRANEFQLFVVSPSQSEDTLDDLVDEVLDAIAKIPNAFFSDATAGAFQDKPAYEITVTFPDDRQTPITTAQKEA
jgi:hypothetical protein